MVPLTLVRMTAPTSDRGPAAHLRRTMLAGLFAVLPVGVTIYLAVLVETQTQVVTRLLFGRPIPVLGLLIVVAGVYLVGLFVTNVVGRWVVAVLDRVLERVPLLREAYRAWKQVSFAAGGGEGMYARVALVPVEGATGQRQMGFTDGELQEGNLVCVFLPATPNPVVGRLVFVPAADVAYLAVSVEEAFKMLISTGNYVPPLLPAEDQPGRGGQERPAEQPAVEPGVEQPPGQPPAG